ncbi:pilus assembly protein TadG-related protein [Novosphingobium album (ex Hu et al. 2023)]|uniref:Pilus assembly protein TadG-related protein n=1 Tax=Novosphingobium album (ex Hu et al. 2023) TaxID=2930093 RepID=A0ABT0B330_9SPHN|nr:pilus assembly protein TadG-related protein [Novosphingobium album (ex Hu et al. 2023)]MCJ2179456.1 pilus assembly protein TadG-related protein [Novosphingobium album (ex Hu et al. 2023)]
MARDAAGNVLALAAVGMVVAVGVVGSAIDMSQAYRLDNRLQAACDAAVLAGRRAVTDIGPSPSGFNTLAQTTASNYFQTNFDDTTGVVTGTTFSATSDDQGITVNGVASTTYLTAVMRLFGFKTIPISASCTSSMTMGNADVVMVLDTTGSMSSSLGSTTRIQALRDAMNNFYTTVASATQSTNARVRYGFVPFATTVNVGKLIYAEDPDYLVDSHKYWSREYTVLTDPTTTYSSVYTSDWSQYSSTSYTTESDCTNAAPANDSDYSNYGKGSTSTSTSGGVTTTTTTQPQRKYAYQCDSKTVTSGSWKNPKTTTVWYIYRMYYSRDAYTTSSASYSYHLINYATDVYKTGTSVSTPTGSEGASVSSTWDGCIEERGTVNSSTFSYSSITGMSPSAAHDVDIDSAPDVGDDNTKWVPMWLDVTYRQKSSNSGSNYTYSPNTPTAYGDHPSTDNCSAEAQLLTEMDATSFSDYADTLTPKGNTYLDVGIIWGGRLLSPNGIFADNVNETPSNGGKVSQHLIFMTDGDMNTTSTTPTAWGMEYWDRRVTSDGSSDNDARHTQRFRAVCDAIKAKGIRLWVIAFTGTLNSDLTYCASSNSSFVAADADSLNSAFQSIATKVSELRVTQ